MNADSFTVDRNCMEERDQVTWRQGSLTEGSIKTAGRRVNSRVMLASFKSQSALPPVLASNQLFNFTKAFFLHL